MAESILLDERVVESLKERFDYAHELDHRDAEHAASPDDERFLLSVSQRLTEDSLSEIVTKDEYERAAKAAVAAQSWERRLQAEQIRLAYLADAENVDGLLAAFSKLIDDLSFDKLYLMDWDDVSWLTEETQLLPALVPVIEKVILNAGGRLKAKQLQDIVKSFAHFVEMSGYDLDLYEEDLSTLIEHAKSGFHEKEISLSEKFLELKEETINVLQGGSVFPLADIFDFLERILSDVKKSEENEAHGRTVGFLLPLLRFTLREGGNKKVIAYESYVFLRIIGQMKNFLIPSDLWQFVCLVFRFLHRNADLSPERSLICHQNFLEMALSRTKEDVGFQKLFVALRLNVFLRGLACLEKRCVHCFAEPEAGKYCENCVEVRYCNKDCQEADVKVHSKECGKKKLLENLAAEMARELPTEVDAPPLSEIILAMGDLKHYEDAYANK